MRRFFAKREAADLPRREAANSACYLYGVLRGRPWRPGRLGSAHSDGLQRIRYRDLAALVRPVPFELPAYDRERVLEHQRVVGSVMRRSTILPAPFGIVFRGRRTLIAFLEDQYLVLDEGLALLHGHWELRLHISAAEPLDPPSELVDLAANIYSELRRFARAAVPFRREDKRLMSAAYLVDRSAWVDFVERANALGAAHASLTFDITGPWPAYDFVRLAL